MMRVCSSRKIGQGFTLVELLVALFLMALVTGLLFANIKRQSVHQAKQDADLFVFLHTAAIAHGAEIGGSDSLEVLDSMCKNDSVWKFGEQERIGKIYGMSAERREAASEFLSYDPKRKMLSRKSS